LSYEGASPRVAARGVGCDPVRPVVKSQAGLA